MLQRTGRAFSRHGIEGRCRVSFMMVIQDVEGPEGAIAESMHNKCVILDLVALGGGQGRLKKPLLATKWEKRA